MSEKIKQSDRWDACPAGALSKMVATQRAKNRQASVGRYSSIVAVLLLVGVGAWMTMPTTTTQQAPRQAPQQAPQQAPPDRGYLVGGIYCTDCIQLMANYRSNQLDQEVATSMRNHLAGCGNCRTKYEEMGGEARRLGHRDEQIEIGYLSHFHSPPSRFLAR